jgi:hypothetical protein
VYRNWYLFIPRILEESWFSNTVLTNREFQQAAVNIKSSRPKEFAAGVGEMS